MALRKIRRPMRRRRVMRRPRRLLRRRSPFASPPTTTSFRRLTRSATVMPLRTYAGRELRCLDQERAFVLGIVPSPDGTLFHHDAYLVNKIPQGTGVHQREGSSAFMRYLMVRGFMSLVPTAQTNLTTFPTTVRVLVIYANIPLSGDPTPASVLSIPGSSGNYVRSFQRPDTRTSYSILVDRYFNLCSDPVTTASGGAGFGGSRMFANLSMSVPVRRSVTFHDGTVVPTAVSEISQGALYVMTILGDNNNSFNFTGPSVDYSGFNLVVHASFRLTFDP